MSVHNIKVGDRYIHRQTSNIVTIISVSSRLCHDMVQFTDSANKKHLAKVRAFLLVYMKVHTVQGDSKYGLKQSNKSIWEHQEDEINNIDGYSAFDELKRMLGG